MLVKIRQKAKQKINFCWLHYDKICFHQQKKENSQILGEKNWKFWDYNATNLQEKTEKLFFHIAHITWLDFAAAWRVSRLQLVTSSDSTLQSWRLQCKVPCQSKRSKKITLFHLCLSLSFPLALSPGLSLSLSFSLPLPLLLLYFFCQHSLLHVCLWSHSSIKKKTHCSPWLVLLVFGYMPAWKYLIPLTHGTVTD